MIENRNGKKVLITPVTDEDLGDIHVGDIIYLDGSITTARDSVHIRVLEDGMDLPLDIKGKAIFHAGPIMKPTGGDPDYEVVSVGPTTSMRMEQFEYDFIKKTGVKVLVGKGGMGANTQRACQEFKAIHCVFPAGCAVAGGLAVNKLVGHYWNDLGMPEALWSYDVTELGPLIVSIDTHGGNLFEANKVKFNKNKDEQIKEMVKHVKWVK